MHELRGYVKELGVIIALMGVTHLLSVERSKNMEVKVLPPGAPVAWRPSQIRPLQHGALPHSILQNSGKTEVLPRFFKIECGGRVIGVLSGLGAPNGGVPGGGYFYLLHIFRPFYRKKVWYTHIEDTPLSMNLVLGLCLSY